MNRRHFSQKSLLYVGGAFALSKNVDSTSKSPLKRRCPGMLQKGDTVALIAPGSSIPDEKIEKAKANIESLGLKTKEGKNIRKKYGYTAGTDQERIADLHWAFSDKSIKGVWCLRGGYGCTRILPFLDYKLIKKYPKPLIGYSDVTALQMAIYKKTGLTTFHGPVGSSEFTPYSVQQIKKILFSNLSTLDILPFEKEKIEVLSPGKAQGDLIGGNLSLISAMCGTTYLPSAKGKIVFLEDIEEKPYRIDRMLIQLEQAWDLNKAKGILLGEFVDCDSDSDRSLSLQETLENHFKDINIPVLYRVSLGHIDNQATYPIGVRSSIDTSNPTIRISEKWMQ